MHIGERIKKLRIAKHLKQRAVANMLGISLTAYGDIERGKTINLTLPRVEQIAGVLKVPATTIINGHSPEDDEHVIALRKELEKTKEELEKARNEIALLLREK
jgi:transcriptional regulator with XRE-family HTH domain